MELDESLSIKQMGSIKSSIFCVAMMTERFEVYY